MPVDLSVKQVPDGVAAKLRERAQRHHRSLQGELRAILEAAVEADRAPAASRTLDRVDYRARLRELDVVAPPSESALMIREDRDGRSFTVKDLFDYVTTLGSGTPDESTEWIRRLRSSR